MSGALPSTRKVALNTPSGVAGDTTNYRPYAPYVAYTPVDAGRRQGVHMGSSPTSRPQDASEVFVGCLPLASPRHESGLLADSDRFPTRPGVVRRATKSFVRNARSKSIRSKAKRGCKRLIDIFRYGLLDGEFAPPDQHLSPAPPNPRPLHRDSTLKKPTPLRQGAMNRSTEFLNIPPPRASPIINKGSRLAQDQWERNHPDRTTELDAAVMALDEAPVVTVPSGPAELPANDTITSPLPIPRPFLVDQSQTFESLLGHGPVAHGFVSSSHAIGLKDPIPGCTSSNALSTGTSPILDAGADARVSSVIKRKPVHSYIPYNSAAAASYEKTAVANFSSAGSLDIPDFNAIARKHAGAPTDEERKRKNRRSWRRGEMHLPPDAHPITRNFQLPSGAVIGGSNDTTTPYPLTIREIQRMKRISGGFLQSGPDLGEVAVGIFEQVLSSTPDEATTPSTEKTPIEDSSPQVQQNAEHRAEEVNHGSHHEDQVSPSPQEADTIPFDASDFPLLNVAARTLSDTGPALLGPLPLGHNTTHTSASSMDRTARGDRDWRWPRFSDSNYEDPAVTHYRKNRAKCIKMRRNLTAKFEANSSPNTDFRISEDDMVTFEADDLARSTSRSTPISGLDSIPAENARLVMDSSDDENNVQTSQNGPHNSVGKRKSALLRSIDFTDNNTGPSPPRRQVNPLDELIDF